MAAGYEIATAWVNLVVSASGVQQTIAAEVGAPVAAAAGKAGDDAGKKFSSGVAGKVKGLAATIGAAFVIRGVANFFNDSMTAVKEWQTINAQTGSVVKSTGGAAGVTATQVSDLAQSLEATNATQAESIQKGANLLLTFKNIKNEVGAGNDIFNQSTAALVDMARAMGQDPEQAAIQLGKALNDPVAGISALSRVGVQFTDDQKGVIESLVATGDTAGAQKIILAELNSQFGGSGAAYADTYAGKMYLLQDSVGDLGEKLVTFLLPGLTAAAEGGTKAFTWVTENLPLIGAIAGAILLLAAAVHAHNLAMAIGAAGGLAQWLLKLPVVTAAQWLWNAALSANPIGIVITLIAALVAGLIWFFTQTELGREVWTNVTNAIATAATWLWESVLRPVFEAIGAIVTWVYENVIQPVVLGIVLYVQMWAAIFTWLWQNVISPVFNALGAAFNWIWSSIIQPVVNWISGAIKSVGDAVRTVFGAIGGFVSSAFQGLVGIVKGPVNAVIGFLNNAIRTVNRISIPVPEWARGLLGGATSIGFNIPTIPMLAGGGTATRSGLALVGERGPELLSLPRGASVIPLDGAARGGAQVTNHIYEAKDDPQLVARKWAREWARTAAR